MGHVLSSLRIGGSVVLAVLGNLVLMPIVAYYLLLDWPAMLRRCESLIPPRWRTAAQAFFADTDAVLGHYLRGQFMVMGVLAVFYAIGLSLVGLDLAWPIGVFTGLAVFVPYLGFGLGLILGVLAALLQFQSLDMVLWVLAVYAAG
ncbi:AI-2E family transporter, partial [Arthrospira platensis SPKY1]|nr:AI-2E family transporter [Arthrospira platensis SPKY1]